MTNAPKKSMSLQALKRKFTAADLVAGRTYRMVAAFDDYDGIAHPAAECWRCLAGVTRPEQKHCRYREPA